MPYKSNRLACVCLHCEVDFSVPVSVVIAKKGGRYCSWECRYPALAPIFSDDGVTASIALRGQDGQVRAYTLVDAADAEWISRWRWNLNEAGYVQRTKKSSGEHRSLRLHRELLGMSHNDHREIDHINHNRLDNRRSNLRIVETRSEQMQNFPSITGSSSRFRGVSWDKRYGKWRARCKVGGKEHYLGLFESEEEAARVASAERLRVFPFTVEH